jgi:acetylglutamate kinase
MTPLGFRFAGINAGIKAARKDMALVACEVPCTTAGSFTINRARAAACDIAESALPSRGIQAIVVNSGNANALTGDDGPRDARAVQASIARALGVPDAAVLSASTGVIGVRLPVGKMIEAAPELVAALGPTLEPAAEAIMTTDTRPKIARRILHIGGREVRLAAFAKGSGMIAPSLATMIAIITTDAVIEPDALQASLGIAVDASFNRIVVDNDMSTNDSVFVMASGLAGNPQLRRGTQEWEEFTSGLKFLCIELARAIAEDGEGATKLVEIRVEGAPDDTSARDVATSIAASNLVKAALFGADPNWGRVLATVGARAGSQKHAIRPALAKVTMQGIVVYDRAPVAHDSAALRARMREPQIAIVVSLADGNASAVAWGCDLSYDYVKINADYTSTIATSADGTVTRDDRLTNYSPAFKRMVLVEALSYIAKFAGKRAVIKCGGAVMIKDALKASFARDVNLLRAAGLLPVVVHGGGPEVQKTLEKLGRKRNDRSDASDARMVEMVLDGRINTELVTLLNASGQTSAVGLSGKDGGLIRARPGGSIASVNTELLEMMLAKKYVPVVSPVALGEDGESYDVGADAVAAEIALSIGAEKLIYLTDVPGVLEHGEIVTEISAAEARTRVADGRIRGGMALKVTGALRALEGGVSSVHIIDGRTPHSVIAELFTDSGVGTLVRG